MRTMNSPVIACWAIIAAISAGCTAIEFDEAARLFGRGSIDRQRSARSQRSSGVPFAKRTKDRVSGRHRRLGRPISVDYLFQWRRRSGRRVCRYGYLAARWGRGGRVPVLRSSHARSTVRGICGCGHVDAACQSTAASQRNHAVCATVGSKGWNLPSAVPPRSSEVKEARPNRNNGCTVLPASRQTLQCRKGQERSKSSKYLVTVTSFFEERSPNSLGVWSELLIEHSRPILITRRSRLFLGLSLSVCGEPNRQRGDRADSSCRRHGAVRDFLSGLANVGPALHVPWRSKVTQISTHFSASDAARGQEMTGGEQTADTQHSTSINDWKRKQGQKARRQSGR